MKIIIAGAGEIGVALTRYLRAEDNDIVLIDNNAENLGNLSEQLDIQTVVGNASYPDVLERAGADHADVFLAVTGNDETNIVSCSVASSLLGENKPAVRVHSTSSLMVEPKAEPQEVQPPGSLKYKPWDCIASHTLQQFSRCFSARL